MVKNESLFSGNWGEATWEFFQADRVPNEELCVSVACVALRYFDSDNPEASEVILTYNNDGRGTKGMGSWEMPGGHIDPLDPEDPDGSKETAEEALARETLEEVGFVIDDVEMFGYREVHNPPSSEYPELAYSPFYVATTTRPLRVPTDPKRLACGTFRIDMADRLVEYDAMQLDELRVVKLGVEAARRAYLF